MKIMPRSNSPTKRIGSKERNSQSGFTLVELLVVISILAILAVITITSINFALGSDVTRSASRQVQSYLAGARDRAIYAKAPRGVRFLLDRTGSQGATISSNRATVTSMVYISPAEPWDRGTIDLERIDESPDDGVPDRPEVYEVRGTGTSWNFLKDRGQIIENARIKIPGTSSGTWYTINLADSKLNSTEEVLRLTTPYREPGNTNDATNVVAFTPGSGPSNYLLELVSEVLPGEEPVLLPNGAAIDLDRSFLPDSWRSGLFAPGEDGQPGKLGVDDDGANGIDDAAELGWPGSDDVRLYSSQLDLMFSPRGSVIGKEAGSGKIHFAIDTIENITSTWLSDTRYEEGDRIQIPARLVIGTNYRPYDRTYLCKTAGDSGFNPSVFLTSGARVEGATLTTDGSVGWEVELNTSTIILSLFTRTGSITASKLNVDGSAFDPFKYAETGEVSK